MSPEDFSFIANMLKERSGLSIAEDKIYLLESRLMPVVRKNGFASIDELIASIKGKNIALAEEVTEAMTTNESFFFRDIKPFDQFKQIVLPKMLKERAVKKTLRIWCAAASSGQEPYSLAMILNEEKAKLQGWRIEIVGTDISKDILDKAKEGRYSQFEVQRGLPVNLLVKYFKKDGDTWLISPEIRSMVSYRYWNLLDDLKGLGSFDVIFCRNVLIYFDHPTKSKVLAKIANQIANDGFLYLGGAETVLGVSNRFKPVPGQRGVYITNEGGNDLAPSGFSISKPQAVADQTKTPVRPTTSFTTPATKTSPLGTKTVFKSPIFKKPIAKPFVSRPTTNIAGKSPTTTNTIRPTGTGTTPTTRPTINNTTNTTRPATTYNTTTNTTQKTPTRTIIKKVIVKKPTSSS